MPWTMVDDKFPKHAKILMLGTGMRGDARRWAWMTVLVYTNEMRSPVVPEHIGAVIVGANPKFLKDCIGIGLIDLEPDGRMVVHDWAIYADVPLKTKVAYLLTKAPTAAANDIARILPHNRQKVLNEVRRQRPDGFKEGVWDDPPLVPESSQPGSAEPALGEPGTSQGASKPGSFSPTPSNEDEGKGSSSSRGVLAVIEGGAITAQTLIGHYVDRHRETTGVPPAERTKGQLARECGSLLKQGYDPELVRAALDLLLEKRLHPSTLSTLIGEAAAGPPRRRDKTRVTPSDILAAATKARQSEKEAFHDAS